MKKLLIALGVVLGLLVVAAIVVPLVVDVDKYRPQIVSAADQQLNGKLELGKLALSLWGQVRVEVGGVKLTDAHGAEVFAVKDAYFHIPFSSLLSGSPELTFKANNPVLNVIKDRAGKLNVMSLMKPTAPVAGTTTAGQPTSTTNATPTSSEVKLPGIAARARIGIELKNALLQYKDELTQLNSKTENLNVKLKDISLSHPTEILVSADLNTTLGKTFALKGPVKLSGEATPTMTGGQLDHVKLTAQLDMNNVEMSSPGVFEKKKGMDCNAALSITASPKEVKIEQFRAKFFNLEANMTGTITNLTLADPKLPANPSVALNLKSNEVNFKPWVELVSMLKEYDLGGTASFYAAINGPSDKLGYSAHLKINALTAKAPNLKTQPKFDGVVDVQTDQISNLELTMQAPGNDLHVKGKMVSFTKPNGTFNVTSSGLDLDQLIDFPKPTSAAKGAASEGAPAGTGAGTQAGSGKAAPASDLDALVEPIRSNKMLADSSIAIPFNIKFIKAENVRLTDLSGKMYLASLGAGLENFSMGVYGGAIKASLASDLRPKAPTYKFSALVDHLDIAQAVESQMALFKNTILGKAHFEMNGAGASFNTESAMANLNARGAMKVADATFTAIDVAKMTSEGINKSIDKIGDKIPQAKNYHLKGAPSGASKYDLISSDFTIAGGKFSAPNFVAKANPNHGMDLKGNVTLGLKDKSLDTNWEVVDTYNLTGAKDISVPIGGMQVPHILAEGNGPVKFPIHIGGTAAQPVYSYDSVTEALAKVATGNVAAAGKAELGNRASKLIQNAPAPVQNAVDSLKKKFGF